MKRYSPRPIPKTFVGEVSFDWFTQETTIEVPFPETHNHHAVADGFVFRNPPPNGRDALIALEVTDNSQREWFSLRLLYRIPPIDPKAHSAASEGFTFHLRKAPMFILKNGNTDEEEGSPFTKPLTPRRLGEYFRMSRKCTVLLQSRVIDVDGLLRFGTWYRKSTQARLEPSKTEEALDWTALISDE